MSLVVGDDFFANKAEPLFFARQADGVGQGVDDGFYQCSYGDNGDGEIEQHGADFVPVIRVVRDVGVVFFVELGGFVLHGFRLPKRGAWGDKVA